MKSQTRRKRYVNRHKDPELLVLPEPKDFRPMNYGPAFDGPGPYPEKWICGGERCCLLGWVALAFDDQGVIGHQPGPAATRFLREIVKAAGGTPPSLCLESVSRVAELLFEGYRSGSPGYGVISDDTPMSPQHAAKIWRKAAEARGYDVEGAK